MPRTPTGWSIAWSTNTERPDEIADEDELRTAEHLGCFGLAVSHALAQAHIAAVRLAVTAQTAPASDGSAQPIAVEVRAQIPGIPLDNSILETILRRVVPACPVWQSLAAELGVQVIGILEEPGATPASPADPAQAGRPSSATSQPAAPWWSLPRLAAPRWLKVLGA
jgi:osmotically inducible protein OsmC